MKARGIAGFTLLELLVVLVVFGFVSVMAYGGLNAVLKSRAQLEQSLDRTARLQKTYQRLREDFQLLRLRPVRDTYGTQRAALIGIREQRVEFTRAGWRNPLLAARPTLERVTYRLEDQRLIRESLRVLDQSQDTMPIETVLLDQVNELRLRYLSPAREWREEWPPLSTTGQVANASAPPPLAVEMTLETAKEGELTFLFRVGVDPLPPGLTLGQTVTAPSTKPPSSGTDKPPAAGGEITPPPSEGEPAPVP